MILKMKKFLLLTGLLSLLGTTGCLVSEEGHGHEGYRHHDHDEVVIGPPILVVRPAVVIVR
jgi:hypothetical protein